MNVLFSPAVQDYYYELESILLEKGYFGYRKNADKYVEDLFLEIEANLPAKLHRSAPKYFDKYGKNMKYASFKKSEHIIWYAFFKTYEENGKTFYLVRYIANNHVIAQYLHP